MAQRVAIVTGGAGGLGRAMVQRLAADGLAVVAADLHEGEHVDVADPDSAQALADRVLEQHGRIDVLVNNAGIAGPTADVVDYPPEEFARVLDVNLRGVFHMTRACLPAMIAAGWGRIVNIASIAGKDGNASMSAYSASKAGVIGLTKSVAKETAQTGVLVNCLVPGVIDAGLTTHTATPQERELFRSRVPMGRMGRPEELAELASWLCSERCSFSTGATYDLSGGRAVY
jgi:NAD(P)-dependent dehydrogenase (short-subunit alcohol dehydrogenase family)